MANVLRPIPHEDLEFFRRYREDLFFPSVRYRNPAGEYVPIIYVDSTAMGSPLRSIEDAIRHIMAQGDLEAIDRQYRDALDALVGHTNGGDEYSFIPIGTGCTGAMNLLFRDILCLRAPERLAKDGLSDAIPDSAKPVFITTLMEHHSTDLTIRECFGKQMIHLGFDTRGLPNITELEYHLRRLRTAGENQVYVVCSGGSNVTGLQPDLRTMAALSHEHGGVFVVDLAAGGPYTRIDLQEINADAIGLSMHKFPGGPQTCGLLILRRSILNHSRWCPPPATMPTKLEIIRTGMVMDIKAAMDIDRIRRLVSYYSETALTRLARNPLITVLGHLDVSRFAIISLLMVAEIEPAEAAEYGSFVLERMYPDGRRIHFVHHNFIARLLSDIYGAQVRPGCSCAGAYGHWLLQMDPEISQYHRNRIDQGLLDQKPGWVRITFNEMNTPQEVETVLDAVDHLSEHWRDYIQGYEQNPETGEFLPRGEMPSHIVEPDWDSLGVTAGGYSAGIEAFIRREILPNAANTHTETSFTGTISTLWYHWAHDKVLEAVGADRHYASKFIRAGYTWVELVLFYLGDRLTECLDKRFALRARMFPNDRSEYFTLGVDCRRILSQLVGHLTVCAGLDEVLAGAAAAGNRGRVL
ncbi:aminotransferase class V-fold PLP-dependent enzyme, partial [bacterium]|nr:aminotransferase class V-fold PLP-dependent enzyme [candidate division CSSED10-310 bacterium]